MLGVPSGEMQGILDRAEAHLEQALAGEILARHGVHGCPERAEALQGWAGELTVPLRERLVRHAGSCQVCSRYLPRNVSATKVFSLLPVPVPPQAMRLRVMACFSDPELVGYRMFVAARLAEFDQLGFPGEEAAPPPPQRRGGGQGGVVGAGGSRGGGGRAGSGGVRDQQARRLHHRRAGRVLGHQKRAGDHGADRDRPAQRHQPGQRPRPPAVAGRPASPAGAVLGNTRGSASPTRLYLRGSSAPVSLQPPSPTSSHPSPGHSSSPAGQLQVAPTQLNLGTGSTGQITLIASGGAVTWSAGTSSPHVTLSSSGGTLAAGQQAVITVSVSRGQNGSGQATIMIGPGGVAVTISWSAPVTSPPPPPPTSPSPTVIPSSPTPTLPSSPTPSLTPTSPTRQSPSPSPSPSGS